MVDRAGFTPLAVTFASSGKWFVVHTVVGPRVLDPNKVLIPILNHSSANELNVWRGRRYSHSIGCGSLCLSRPKGSDVREYSGL
jgi:hypothetical protein